MFTVDASDVHRVHALAVKELRGVRGHMLRIGKWAAAYERATHPYTNRTYRLQRSTQANLSTMGPDETWLTVRMDMHYASYVNNLGYSNIDFAISHARGMLDAVFAGFGRGLT